MKSRFAASIYLFSAGGGTYGRNTCKAMSSRSIVTCFDCRQCQIYSRFQARGLKSSSRAVHSFAEEDEAFSELGPEISECSPKLIKLVTEKPDHLVKVDHSKRELAGRPLSSDKGLKIKEIIASIGRTFPTSNSKLGGRSHVSTFTDDTEKIPDIESPAAVSVKNILSSVGLYEVVEAISVFGKVSGASFVTASDGLRCCNIQFEDVESSRRAISAGEIAVGSQVFPVHPLDAVHVVAIRINNINKETTDYAIHSRCKSLGEFVGLARKTKDVVDVFFNVRNDIRRLKLLKNLNNIVIDQNRWSAEVLTSKSESSEVSSDEEARYKTGLRILDQIGKLKEQINVKKVALEDLEALNVSILHIQDSASLH